MKEFQLILTLILLNIAGHSQTAEYYFAKGIKEFMSNDAVGAIQDFNKAIELNPKHAEAYNNRGLAKIAINDYQGAIQDFNKAIELNANNAEAYYNRGLANAYIEFYGTAIQDYNKAIELSPDMKQAYLDRGLAKYSVAYNNENEKEATNDYKGAIQDFNKAIELNHPENARAFYLRGITNAMLKDINGACLDWNKAEKLGYSQASGMISKYCKSDQLIANCNCEKIKRDDNTTVTQCPPLPVSSDNTTQIGLSVSSNGADKFLSLTIRFKETAINVIGNISIRLEDNNMFTLKLVNSGLSYIGNNEVTNAVFILTKENENLLKKSNIKTVSVTFKDNLLHTYTVSLNADIVKKQIVCF